jgi:hypothetical protein
VKLPNDGVRLAQFAKELIDQCMISREDRRIRNRLWRQLYYTGDMGAAPSKYNRCYSHVDKLSSYIFSPADVRFTLDFEGSTLPEWAPKAERAAIYLNRKFNRAGCGAVFAQANETSLVEGAAIVKLTWGPGGRLQPWHIRPSFFGVFREDIEDLDRQEAFVHSFYVTKDGFARMIANHRDRLELAARVSISMSQASAGDLTGDSYFHEIVAGGMAPISYTPGASNAGTQYGNVAITAPQTPQLAPDVAADLIRVDDLWVWNDDLEDWTTLRYVEPFLLLEGRYQKRNLSDIKGRHPFTKVSSNNLPGYFWGRSELANLYMPQNQLSRRTDNIDSIFNLRAKPPRAFSGFQSLTDEKARALLSPGGSITEQAIGAKVDDLAPEMPAEALAYLEKLEEIFDDVAGFTNILSGEGEPGVRAGVHAGTLLRTSTPRLRDRALLVEHQCGNFGNDCLGMLRTKDPMVLIADDGTKFTLDQLPADAEVTVDSHTSSPAFVDDNRQVAFALAKAEAIDGETLIEMLHPPREELLKARLRARQAEQAKFLAEHPEAAAESRKK